MNPQTAKTEYYTLNGHTTAWPEYVKKLAKADELDYYWERKDSRPLSSKLPPSKIKKNLISNTVSILSREWHRDLP